MRNNPKTICWDTNCFIAKFNEERDRIDVCNAILEAAKTGEVTLYTSFLTMCELVKIKGEYASEAEDKIVEFLRNPYIHLVAIDFAVSRITRSLVRQYKLGVKDAIHLATAISLKVDVLHTYDSDERLKLNGIIPEIKATICKPTFSFQTTTTILDVKG